MKGTPPSLLSLSHLKETSNSMLLLEFLRGKIYTAGEGKGVVVSTKQLEREKLAAAENGRGDNWN